MNSSEPLLFPELASTLDPSSEFAQFRIGKKIIQVPCSFWKDGRIRADLSEFGAGEVVSRNGTKLQERIIQVLRESFGTIVEAVCQEFSRVRSRQAVRPRLSNKLPAIAQTNSPKQYINPFAEKWSFGKCPDWLLTRREPTAVEKHIYGKLLFPVAVCGRWDKDQGVIFELNQGELAKAIGISRPAANRALMSLRRRGLLELIGQPGARQVIRFLRHEWITCNLKAQVGFETPVNEGDKACSTAGQPPVTSAHKSCPMSEQLAVALEKENSEEEESPRQLSDADWLKEVVRHKFPEWTLDQLKLQWQLHRKKGKEKGKWIPGDRGHFLAAWMPKAGDPPTKDLPDQPEPTWWKDFLGECHPNAAERSFDNIAKRYPDIVAQGRAWAARPGDDAI